MLPLTAIFSNKVMRRFICSAGPSLAAVLPWALPSLRALCSPHRSSDQQHSRAAKESRTFRPESWRLVFSLNLISYSLFFCRNLEIILKIDTLTVKFNSIVKLFQLDQLFWTNHDIKFFFKIHINRKICVCWSNSNLSFLGWRVCNTAFIIDPRWDKHF